MNKNNGMNKNAGGNVIYTVKRLNDNGEPELNERGNPIYQMVNAVAYGALAGSGRAKLVTAGVASEGRIIRR